VERFTQLVAAARLPVYALGGIDVKNAPELLGSGACGIAVVSALVGT
jgi:thiamine-phosphate pyrophosphorylase